MNLFVDTSVWSLAFRRDAADPEAAVQRLQDALAGGEAVFSTGLVLQEVLQGVRGPKSREELISRFSVLPLLVPERQDHIAAADLRNECRRAGIQVGTIDALLARLCVRHGLVMLSTDQDFQRMAPTASLTIWGT